MNFFYRLKVVLRPPQLSFIIPYYVDFVKKNLRTYPSIRVWVSLEKSDIAILLNYYTDELIEPTFGSTFVCNTS